MSKERGAADMPVSFSAGPQGPDEEQGQKAPFDLEGLDDEALRALALKAQELLARRDKEKRAAALREIQRLAKEHGLSVEVKEPAKKRGRPAKTREGG